MSVLLTAVLLGSQALVAPLLPPEEDIIVVGERMRRVKLVTKTDRKSGLTRCVFKRRSGDDAFDSMMCTSAIACTTTVTVKARPQMQACMREHLDAYVRGVAARRDAAKAKAGR